MNFLQSFIQFKNPRLKPPPLLLLYFKIYFFYILIFLMIRMVFYFYNSNKFSDDGRSLLNILLSFVNGLRFDLVVTGYITLVPFIFNVLFEWTRVVLFLRTVFVLLLLISFPIIVVCLADIPWFNHFFQRIHCRALEWMDRPGFVFSMIGTEWKFIWPAFLIPVFFVIIYKFLQSFFIHYKCHFEKNPYRKGARMAATHFLMLFFIFIGIRGRVTLKSPIRAGTAYFCNDAFLNQNGLNGFYTFIQSAYEKYIRKNTVIKLTNTDSSFAFCKKDLGRGILQEKEKRMLYKHHSFSDSSIKITNVIVVLMESMSAEKMKRHGMNLVLTPFLDSLSHRGIYFSRCYSCGIHTFNGVFSTITGLPGIFGLNPMKRTPLPVFHTVFTAMKKHGYITLFFTTHDAQFDNMEGFVRSNGADYVICDNHYPKNELKTTLGVPDDVMFRFSLGIYDTLYKKNKKFFSIMLTSSDHGPYYIPEYFKPKNRKNYLASVEYADYSLRVFISEASKRQWYKNTLFVFIADHGAAWDNYYSIPYSYVHVPLLFFDPNQTNNKEIKNLASQTDVFPSIFGYLGLDFDNYSMGIDLFHEKRNHVVFCADDLTGIMNDSLILIRYPDDHHEIFRILQRENLSGEYPETEKKLKNGLKHYFQCAAEIQYNYRSKP